MGARVVMDPRLELLPDLRQSLDQLAKPVLAQVSKATVVFLGHDPVELVDETFGLRGDSGSYPAPILALPRPFNQSRINHSVEQARYVGHACEESFPKLVPAESFGFCTPKNPQHVELCGSNTVRLQHLFKGVDEHRPGADDAQLSFLLDAAERLLLLELMAQIGCHDT
jgi:hypothetical protein